MSDTLDEAQAPLLEAPPPANFSVTQSVLNMAGQPIPVRRITFGEPQRSIVVRELGLGDQFDLVEIAGSNAGNPVWMGMAGFAFAVTEIDGTPLPQMTSVKGVRAVLNRIKPDGMAAYFHAMKVSVQSDDSEQEKAKNS